ncbi:MAG: DM13 domain-containing protein [Nitrososphaerales archaeon]
MNKTTFIGITIAATILVLISSPIAQYQADAAIKDNMMGRSLAVRGDLTSPADEKPFGGSEVGNFLVRAKDSNLLRVIGKVNNGPSDSKVLEGWLVDVQTGYKLSIGQLSERNTIVFTQKMVNPWIYDLVVITEEPVNDIDPAPHTPIGGAQLTTGTSMPEKQPAMTNDEMTKLMEDQEPRTILTGNFVDADFIHKTEGTAEVITVNDSQTKHAILNLENFKATNGPDLHVYLSKDPRNISQGYVDLGKLKNNIGNQNYHISHDVNLDEYKYVLIWCEPFSVLFGYAELNVA